MRQILIDRARAAYAIKRGGGEQAYSLSGVGEWSSDDPAALLRVDAALNHVRAVDPRLATLVELKIFGGLDVAELADALEISERSVKRSRLRNSVWQSRASTPKPGLTYWQRRCTTTQ